MSTILDSCWHAAAANNLELFSLDEKCFASRLFALNETQDIILK